MIFRQNIYLFGFRFRRKYVCIYNLHSFVVLPFLVSQGSRGSRRSSSGSQSPPSSSSSAQQGILEEEDGGDSNSIKQVGPIHETKVVNEMLQISTFFAAG